MRRISDAPDYWVPEDYMYKTGEECIGAHPDQAAAGVFNSTWQFKYDQLKQQSDMLYEALKVAKILIKKQYSCLKDPSVGIDEALKAYESFIKESES